MTNFIFIIIVLVILLFSVLFTKIIFKNTTSEQSRKIIHVTLGLTTLIFPLIFTNYIPVVILGIIAFIGLLMLKNIKYLKNKFGAGLFDVERKSYGELYFVIAIVVVFSLYKILNLNVIYYLIPIATLTFADSTAALVGVKYGQNKLSTENEDTKSLEGSFIFFVVAFMCCLIPLQLMTNVGRLEVLLISTFVGILSAMIEMTSHDGNDNFLLPFLTFLILQYNLNESANTLINISIIVGFMIFVCIIVTMSTKISKLAFVSALLCGYMTLMLGSMNWLYIPLLEFAFFSIIPRTNEREKNNVLNYKVIEYNVLIGSIFVYIKSITGWINICFLSFLISYCMSLCMNTYVRLHIFYQKSETKSIIYSIIKTIIIIEIPYILFNTLYLGVIRWWDWIIVLGTIILSAYIIKALEKKYDYSVINLKAAQKNTLYIGITSFLVFFIYLILGGTGCIILN